MSKSKTKAVITFILKAATIAISFSKKFWKWYIAGFVGHSHKKFYFPRMVRLALGFMIVVMMIPILSIPIHFFKPDFSLEYSTKTSSSSTSGKNGGTLCAANFNQAMEASAKADFDGSSGTMNITISDSGSQELTRQEFEKISTKFADSIFSGCYVESVKIKSNTYSIVRKSP
ncbi:hypothetical protein [Calothrix sp. UHCC 0171]|uniref:hypothetical protein n=1 Tax=Calothrix sp. UHCC 0171 TaxID=3110245 RepID=UPI002B21BF3A|nr:hypothetical protein [Calothrix sp. UHCC 0171]MEA5571575.1 hypothetical protein [Calothrix sp. UHCC 0171]